MSLKRRLLGLATICWCVSLTCRLARAQSNSTAAEAEIRATMDQRMKASVAGDSDAVVKLMTDEYLQTDISGYVQNKDEWFRDYFDPLAKLIKDGSFRWVVYKAKDVQIRVYGDCAVVVGSLELSGTGARWSPQQHTWIADPAAGFNGTLRFTHVYVKRDGKWLLAALHNAAPIGTPKTEGK